MRAPRGEVHMFRCGSAGFRIYTVLYVLIPHAFAPIHLFRGSATNVNFSPRARRPREFQHIIVNNKQPILQREGRNSCLLHYHETSGLAQTREESVHTTLYIYKILHCHTETCVPHREVLAPNIQILNTSSR